MIFKYWDSGTTGYTYVRDNPLRLVDPSGMAECAAGDTACWQSEWEWKNRWYEAHGWFAEGNGWTRRGDPKMQDAAIARDVLGEADIHLSGTGRWTDDSIMQMAYGVARFAARLEGGMNQLRHLLGVDRLLWSITVNDTTCAGAPCAPPMLGAIWFPSSRAVSTTAMDFVHELGHVIDWTSSFLTLNGFSAHWGYEPLTNYAAGQGQPYPISWDRWAEAVTVWVFGGVDKTGNFATNYKTTEVGIYAQKPGTNLTVQMNRMTELLNGWR